MDLLGRFLVDAAAGSLVLLPLAPRGVVGAGFRRLSVAVAAVSAAIGLGVGGLGALAAAGPVDLVLRAASALVLGGSIQAMLLGHWYLVRPAMPIEPFVRLHHALLAALAVRVAVGAPAWPAAWDSLAGDEVDVAAGLLVAARVLVGYVAVGAGTAMSLACARIRSTQSATGILYVVLLWAVAGELIGGHLAATRGWTL